ncbi:hypothetical protein ACP4OV_012679 [Aristida adscensionis]
MIAVIPFTSKFLNLIVNMKDVKPTSLLKDRIREVEGNPDFSNKDVSASQTPVVAEVSSAVIPALTHVELQPEISSTSHAMSLPNTLNQHAAPVRLPSNSAVEEDKINPKLGSLVPQLQYNKIMDLALDTPCHSNKCDNTNPNYKRTYSEGLRTGV